MVIFSLSNILICFCQLFSLVNECQLPFGIFCSSIRRFIWAQYMKMIFGEFFKYFLISMSHLMYIAFALNRLSLIGKDHDRITRYVSDVNVTKIMGFSVVFSTLVSIVKPFQYKIHSNMLFNYPFYPILHTSYDEKWYKNLKDVFILVFNGVYNFLIYVVFVVINLIIDILLLVRLRRVTREREKKFQSQSENIRQKIKEEDERSIKEVTHLILFNILTNFTLKIPTTITSLNDIRALINYSEKFTALLGSPSISQYVYSYSMDYFCYMSRGCQVFQVFGNFLFLMSLFINFFLIRKFDKNFGKALSKKKT